MKTIECWKCFGKGYIRGFEHVASGRCFTCGGSGEVDVASDSSKKRLTLNFWVVEADKPRTYLVRSALSEETKHHNTPVRHWDHKHTFTDSRKAWDLCDKIEAAKLTTDHLDASTHWSTPEWSQ